MGCDCCNQQAPVLDQPTTSVTSVIEETSGCQDSCCDGNDSEALDTNAPVQGEPAQQKPESCCSSGKQVNEDVQDLADAPDCCQNSCCDDNDSKSEPLDLKAPVQEPESCCSANEQVSENAQDATDAPDCCRGKVSPCCDASCLDRLAMRECEASAQGNACSEAADGKACSQHSLSAMDRYGAILQALGCICRSLIALGQETCCDPRERQAPTKKQCSKKSSTRSVCPEMPDTCCSSSIATSPVKQTRANLRKRSGESTRCDEKVSTDACLDSCCSKNKPVKRAPVTSKCSKPCCSEGQCGKTSKLKTCCTESGHPKAPSDTTSAIAEASSLCCRGDQAIGTLPMSDSPSSRRSEEKATGGCAGSCCKPANAATPVSKAKTGCEDSCCSDAASDPPSKIEQAPVQTIIDVENQGTGKEHVVLSISGMTCTGCETKLNRILATIPAVKDLKTSLVLSRAEFNIDLTHASVEEVMKHLERKTEFKCERVQNQGCSLELIVPQEPSTFMSQSWPDGVSDMVPVDKQTVRVTFDPKIVGARDLAEKIWGPPIELAPPRGDISLEAGSKHVRHMGYTTLFSAALTIPVLVMAWAPLPERELEYSSASLGLATIVQVFVAGPFYPKALKALVFSRVIEMDLLIVLSTSAAYIFSVVCFGYLAANRPLPTDQFFETSTLLVTLIMVGRWVAALARQRAVESISVRSLQVSAAILVDEESGTEREIDARLLQYGDIFKVLPETRIPTDGTVIKGASEVDESMITGESRPVEKYPKSIVIAGSLNGSGVMTVRLNRLPSDNTISTIAAMVDEAKLSKPKLQDLADRVASYFVPVVLALTIITFVIWIAVGMAIRGYDGTEATIEAITYAITVLIVSCPCAIGLAVPMVIVIASGVASEKGVIFKSANAIEIAHKTSHVVFDKTGTLTRGKLSVVKELHVDDDKLSLLLGLIENSRHPVSVAVSAHLKTSGVVASTVSEPKNLTGKGVEATSGDHTLRAGNSRWLNLSNHELVQPMLAQGYSVFCFVIDDALEAVFGLEDELRPDAVGTIEALQKRGVSVHMVSGDDNKAVQSLALKLNIPSDNVRSQSSPADKKDYIQMLLGTSPDHKKPVVVFCGDGTNDAVALTQATIGVHMNEGTDVAQSAADVVLMRPVLGGILTMMNASRKSVNRIRFNFGWSFVYNTFAVLLAAGAFVNARIPPEFAGLGELVSVLPVIAAAVLLRWSVI